MTGYGDAEREAGTASIRAEIRTVNHRYLNLRLRTPPGYDRHQPRLEGVLKDHFVRGQVTLSLAVGPAGRGDDRAVRVDVDRARTYLEGLREVKRALELEGEVTLAMLAGFRDLFEAETAPEVGEVDEEQLLEVVAEAAARAAEMRREEGERLGADLRGRLDAMEVELGRVEERAPVRLIEERDRLRQRIRDLMDGEREVDEERIHREVAHLAERWDIHEEIVRFRSHVKMFRDTLDGGDSAGVGKRLGFVAQELLREANTIGSKANDAAIARSVVALKEEIDRLREQLENLE